MFFLNILIPLLFSFFSIHYIKILSINNNVFIDHPKIRGQHQISKPRSGGICFFLSLIIFLYFDFFFEKNIPLYLILILIFYSNINFLIGIIDDYKNLNFKIKLTFQVFSSIITIIIIDKFFGFITNELYFYFFIIFFFSITFININNFMDGTDAIVITNFIFFIIINILYSIFINYFEIIPFLLWLLTTSLVFILHNFPPSKIFLGDSGSYLLGSIVVVAVCYLAITDLKYIFIFLNIYSFFFIDTSFTLLIRFKNKENIFTAHNKHLYQQLSSKNKKLFSINYIIYMSLTLIFVCLTVFYDAIVIFTFLNYILLSLFYFILKKNEIS